VRLLLDTQVFLWWLADSRRLNVPARARIGKADEVLVSTASLWEATVKMGLGKLDGVEPLRAMFNADADKVRVIALLEPG